MNPTKSHSVDLSVVIPVYFNEGSLHATMESLRRDVFDRHPDLKAEVIFVDDGSRDGSFQELLNIRAKYPSMVKLVRFTRNFGQASALKAGFERARGENIVFVSADGQDPVELINQMLESRQTEGCEIIVAAREGRDESLYRILTSKLFYRMIRWMSFPDMPLGGFDFALLSRRALETLLESWDAQPFIQGQIWWTGYRTTILHYTRRQRTVGRSRWTFPKKISYMLDGVMNYSFLPIRMVSIAGLLIAVGGFVYALVVLLAKVFVGNPVKGWTPLMVVVLVLGGFQMLTLGIFGEYLWRIFAQVKARRPYVVEEEIGFTDGQQA